MAFQTQTFQFPGFGVPGEIYNNYPRRGQSFILNSSSPNTFGYGFSITSQGVANVGNTGGTQIFAGILVNPKGTALLGTTSSTLAPSLVVPNNYQGELVTAGSVIVSLPAAANIGDQVLYDQTTGALTTQAPTNTLPSGKSFAFALVDFFTIGAAGLAVITLTPTLTPIP
jgi:hypothetical protein